MHNQQLVGVVSYGTPCFAQSRGWLATLAQVHGLSIVQLCRGGTAPNAVHCTASKLISAANKAVAIVRGPLIVVAYSDEEYCEIGTVYQASNFLYTGRTNPKHQCNYVIDGRKMTGWQVRKKYGTRDRKKLNKMTATIVITPLKKKHRYIYIVANRFVKRAVENEITDFILPYPKRHQEGVPNMLLVDGKRVPCSIALSKCLSFNK